MGQVRRRLVLTGLVLLAFSLVAVQAQGRPIRIGVVANQTTDFALAGQMLLNGIDMAVAEVNAAGGVGGRRIELVVADAAKDNTTAVNAFTKVASANPAAVFLPIYSTQVMAILPQLKKNPVISFTAASNPLITKQGIKYLFRTRPHDGMTAAASVYAAVNHVGKKKIGLIHVNNEYGNGAAVVQKEIAGKLGVTIVGEEAYAATDKDFKPLLLKLRNQGAELLLHWGHPGDTALVVKQRKELGITIPFLTGVTIVSPAVIALMTPDELDGVYAVIDAVGVPAKNPNADVRAWAARYRARYNTDPDYSSFTYYQAMKALAKDLAVGTDFGPLLEAVAATQYTGLGGIRLGFDGSGDVIQNIALVQFTGNEPSISETVIRTK